MTYEYHVKWKIQVMKALKGNISARVLPVLRNPLAVIGWAHNAYNAHNAFPIMWQPLGFRTRASLFHLNDELLF